MVVAEIVNSFFEFLLSGWGKFLIVVAFWFVFPFLVMFTMVKGEPPKLFSKMVRPIFIPIHWLRSSYWNMRHFFRLLCKLPFPAKCIDFLRDWRWNIRKPFWRVYLSLQKRYSHENPHEPLKGYKSAGIRWDDATKRLIFKPTRVGKNKIVLHYLATDKAKCRLGYTHLSPDDNCTCGFYAVRHPRLIGKVKGSEYETPFYKTAFALLEVELYGKIVSGKYGYRAEKQRVLKVNYKRRCGQCCMETKRKHFVFPRRAIGFGLLNQSDTLVPVCKLHSGRTVISLADLSGYLGTEVAWQ